MRNKNFTREMRAKHIKRKKRISNMIHSSWYDCDGKYSKGKIHCSCGMCSDKTRNKKYKRRHLHANYAPSLNWKHSDLIKIQSMENELKELNN